MLVWGTVDLEMGLVAEPNGLKEVQVELKLLFGLAHEQHTPICIGVTELFCLHNLVGKQLMSFLRILSMVDRPNNHSAARVLVDSSGFAMIFLFTCWVNC